MKPIKLIISSFGPYAGLMPEINFERFEDKGLFLITGDTGAGKTMIFVIQEKGKSFSTFKVNGVTYED